MFQSLQQMGAIDIEKAGDPAMRARYISNVCAFAALGLGSMPAVQMTLGLVHPEISAEDRIAKLNAAIAGAFGLDPVAFESRLRALDRAAAAGNN